MNRKLFLLLTILVLTLGASASPWESMGLGGGGQILLTAPDPANASTVYLGSDVAGLWRSEDQGATWQYLTQGWTPNQCQSLAFDPADADRMFIGLEDGVFQSNDRGQTWAKLVSATNVGALAVVRDGGGNLIVYFGTGLARDHTGGDGKFYRLNYGGSNVLESFPYAATSGAVVTTLANLGDSSHLWISTGAGVFRSLNGGATWTAVNAGLTTLTCGRLLADPANFDSLLVAVRGLSAGITGGIARKPSGSGAWTSLSGNLSVVGVDWNSLATNPAAFGQEIWAGSSTSPNGIYYTPDGLAASPTWSARQAISDIGWASANPIVTNPGSLVRLADGSFWTGKNGNFHRSTNAGVTWQQRYTTRKATVAAITPGANQGRRRADDWINRGMSNTVDNMVAIEPSHPERILVALADRAVFASVDGGVSFHQYAFRFDTLNGNSGFLVAFHPTQSGVAYASLKDAFGGAEGQKTSGLFQGAFQTATQVWAWSLLAGGDANMGGLPKDALPSALVFSADGSVMWLVARAFNTSADSSRGVWESRNGGMTWQQIGLSNRNVECIAAHPTNADILLVGVRNGKGGQGMVRGVRSSGTWTFTQPKLLTPPKACYSVAFDPTQPGVAYAAVGTTGGVDVQAEVGLYRSVDDALNWVKLTSFANTSPDNGTQAVTTSSIAGACFASRGGTFEDRAALRRSSDSGAAWASLYPPWPDCNSLRVSQGATPYLYAATSGMGLWRVPLAAAVAEIVVEQPLGVSLLDDSDTIDFGAATIGMGTAAKAFTIRNTGGAELTGLMVSKDGSHSGDFAVDATGASTSLASDGSTTFTVAFAPTAAGMRTAALHIASSDADENPFDLVLTGTGLTVLESWRQANFGTTANTGNAANTASPDGDPFCNLLEFAFGTDPNNAASGPGAITYASGVITLRAQPAISITDTATGVDFRAVYGRRKDWVAAGLTYTVQFSADMSAGSWESSSAIPTAVASDAELDAVTVPYPFFLSTGEKAQFFRVHVTIQ